MNPLHAQFVAEARELIDQATEDLLALERGGAAGDSIERVFRSFHTLKGGAGVVDLPAMAIAMHAAEDLLAAIRTGRLAITPQIIDAVLSALDQVAAWVDAFAAGATLPAAAGADARRIADQLRALASAPTAAPRREGDASDAAAPALPPWLDRLLARDGAVIRAYQAAHSTALTAIAYSPHGGCFFDGDDPLTLMRRVPQMLAFSLETREPWPPSAEFDPFACNLCFSAITAADRPALAEIFRLVPDQVTFLALPPLAPKAPSGVAESDRPEESAAQRLAQERLAQELLAEQGRVLAAGSGEDAAARFPAVARVAVNVLRHVSREDRVTGIEQALVAAIGAASAAPLAAALEQAAHALARPPADPAPNAAALADDISPDEAALPSAKVPAGGGRAPARALRIDETKIDRVLNLAGELTVSQLSLAQLLRRVTLALGDDALVAALRSEVMHLERVAGEIRGAALQLRMVPVAQVFRAFPRPLRDMAQRLGKDIALVTQGETNESDKAIIELLFEPLLHLVRNAADHGIEPRDARRAAGKPEQATITLRALRTGERFRVEVSDDGRGIDPAAIRRKASETLQISPEALAARPDAEMLDLIFTPGFSTAADISDISGRGVGMDVVRSTVERVGGRVLLASELGRGTTVTLDLPASVAMLRIMVVEAGGQSVGIPMDAVLETVRVVPDAISRIKHSEALVWHDTTIPVRSLAGLLALAHKRAAGASPAPDRLLVIAEANGKLTALAVDAIRDRFDAVLKPMQGLLAQTPGFAGTTMLGDGSVLLVLDLRELLA